MLVAHKHATINFCDDAIFGAIQLLASQTRDCSLRAFQITDEAVRGLRGAEKIAETARTLKEIPTVIHRLGVLKSRCELFLERLAGRQRLTTSRDEIIADKAIQEFVVRVKGLLGILFDKSIEAGRLVQPLGVSLTKAVKDLKPTVLRLMARLQMICRHSWSNIYNEDKVAISRKFERVIYVWTPIEMRNELKKPSKTVGFANEVDGSKSLRSSSKDENSQTIRSSNKGKSFQSLRSTDKVENPESLGFAGKGESSKSVKFAGKFKIRAVTTLHPAALKKAAS